MLDRLTRPRVLRLSRLKQHKDVLRARCRPHSEQMVIRISEGSPAADRHQARVPDLREDHGWHSFCLHPPNTQGRARATRHAPQQPAHPTSEVLAQQTTWQMLTTPSRLDSGSAVGQIDQLEVGSRERRTRPGEQSRSGGQSADEAGPGERAQPDQEHRTLATVSNRSWMLLLDRCYSRFGDHALSNVRHTCYMTCPIQHQRCAPRRRDHDTQTASPGAGLTAQGWRCGMVWPVSQATTDSPCAGVHASVAGWCRLLRPSSLRNEFSGPGGA